MLPNRWTVRFTSHALADLYSIERGDAATVSTAILALSADPTPEDAELIDGETAGYVIAAGGHFVGYEVQTEARVIRVVFVR